jgi:pimeloyl-ACP methyl ester carboxylesterase
MRTLKQTFARAFTVVIAGIIILFAMLYFNQEELIFFPTKLPANHVFRFNSTFQERYISTPDGHNLHGLLFKADSSAGLIFYLHGNAGGLDSWGEIAETYTKLNYDIFMLDYRGYGKSEGQISSEKQFHDDVQLAYEHVKKEYPEEKIVVLGYSIGTGTAAHLAAHNKPKMLILQSPYYSLIDLAQKLYPMVPSGIIKYKFKTHEYVEKTEAPVVLIHGDQDEVIYYGSSLKLKEHLKPEDQLITMPGQPHNGFTENPEYIKIMQQLLNAPKSRNAAENRTGTDQ